ncbi:hypothetical protein KY361_05505 [Candidatus Woesearchaeota archaeon]|nr:hypothetical protein [Candidatus Woesearchaeota archaeon]
MPEYERPKRRIVEYEGLQILVNETPDGRLLVVGSVDRVGSKRAHPINPDLEQGAAQAIYDSGLQGPLQFIWGSGRKYERREDGSAQLTPRDRAPLEGFNLGLLREELEAGLRETGPDPDSGEEDD